MVVVDARLIVFFAFVCTGLFLLARRYDPQRPGSRLLRKSVAGLFLLLGWNLITGQQLAVNPLSALICGSLGLPGAVLTALLRLL